MTQEKRQEKKKELDSASESKTSLKNIGLPVILLKQSDGKPSASFTMVFLAFNVCLLWLLLSIFEGIGPIKPRAFDAGQAMAFLSPLLALYFSRRFTDKSKDSEPTLPKSEGQELNKTDSEA